LTDSATTSVCTLPALGCATSDVSALKAEPKEIVISADGAAYLKGLTWSHWGTLTATGKGILEGNNCIPDCAKGTYAAYAATVTLSVPISYGTGEQAYSVIVIQVPSSPSRSEKFSSGLVPLTDSTAS
jgi:hypothetical protein